MAAHKQPRSAQEHPPAPARPGRYRVRSSGISTPTGTVWRGETVTAAALGDAARVAHLLAKRAIEDV